MAIFEFLDRQTPKLTILCLAIWVAEAANSVQPLWILKKRLSCQVKFYFI